MAKVWVKLKDTGSIFHNTQTDESITGRGAMEMTDSPRLQRAIAGGIVKELTKDEAKKHNETVGHNTDGSEKNGATETKAAAKSKDAGKDKEEAEDSTGTDDADTGKKQNGKK